MATAVGVSGACPVRRAFAPGATARRIIAAAPRLGIKRSPVCTFLGELERPPAEVNAILRLLHEYLLTETSNCIAEGVASEHHGRRDRMPATLPRLSRFRGATARGTRLTLRMAVDYSAREAIFHAACRFYKVTKLSPESFSEFCRSSDVAGLRTWIC